MIWGCVWMLPCCSDSNVNKKCEQVFMDSFWTDFPCRLYELINVLISLQYCTSLLNLMGDRCCFFVSSVKANCEVNPNQREVPSSRHLAVFTILSIDGQNPAKKFIWCISSHIPSGCRCISFFYSVTGDSTMSGLAEVAHNSSALGPWQVPWFFDTRCLSIAEMLQRCVHLWCMDS